MGLIYTAYMNFVQSINEFALFSNIKPFILELGRGCENLEGLLDGTLDSTKFKNIKPEDAQKLIDKTRSLAIASILNKYKKH
jgi:hypothetical protein